MRYYLVYSPSYALIKSSSELGAIRWYKKFFAVTSDTAIEINEVSKSYANKKLGEEFKMKKQELTTPPYHLAGYWEYQKKSIRAYDVIDSKLNCKAVDAVALAEAAGVVVEFKEAISDFVNSPRGKTYVDGMIAIVMPHEKHSRFEVTSQ